MGYGFPPICNLPSGANLLCERLHLESEINGSRLNDPDELALFLRQADLRFTGKLVARLLALGTEGLGHVFRSIDDARRAASSMRCLRTAHTPMIS
jgi:hypothetical protein